jgi:hypothetical protein
VREFYGEEENEEKREVSGGKKIDEDDGMNFKWKNEGF